MRKVGNYYYPKTNIRKLRLERLNYLPSVPHYDILPSESLIFPPDYLSHAQLICISGFLT